MLTNRFCCDSKKRGDNKGMRSFLIFVSLFVGIAKANAEDNYLAGADEAYGEYLSSECLACHNQQGSAGIPSINGLDAMVLAQKLRAYRSKELENQVMRLVAGNLDDEQIASLALYFSKINSSK